MGYNTRMMSHQTENYQKLNKISECSIESDHDTPKESTSTAFEEKEIHLPDFQKN